MRPRMISPIVVAGLAVIFTGMAFLMIISPLPSAGYAFLHQQNPHAVCFTPAPEEKTMESIWNTIVNRSGADPGSAEFQGMDARLNADGTIGELSLSFFASVSGERRRISADLRYDPATCGNLYIGSSADAPVKEPAAIIRSPQEIMVELARIRPSVFGITGQPVTISTQAMQATDSSFSSLPCTSLFLLENMTITRLDRVIVYDSRGDTFYWRILPRDCYQVPVGGETCTSSSGILVFSKERLASADLVRAGTEDDLTVTTSDCPRGTITGTSCKRTFWGEECINWTI